MPDGPPWHEEEAFWEALRPHLFPEETIEEGASEVDRVLDLAGADAGASILDVPCGIGRHAVELADRGFRVTAVDATEPYLDTARDRASEAGADVEFVHADMREFRRPEAFDLVLNLYTSFGYFRERADDERTARNVYESLRPGGALVMSLASKETIAAEFRERTWEEQDGTYLLAEREIRDDWSWIENRWIVVADEGVREFTVSHRLYSAFELRQLLERVGFGDVTAYGDLEGGAYDQDAEQLVVVARK